MKANFPFLKNNRFRLSTLVLAVFFGVSSAKAQIASGIGEKTEGIQSAKLAIRNLGQLQFRVEVIKPILMLTDIVRVSVVDCDTRRTLYTGLYSHYSLKIMLFDLSNLQDGTYQFEVVEGPDKIAQVFAIRTQTKRVILAQN